MDNSDIIRALREWCADLIERLRAEGQPPDLLARIEQMTEAWCEDPQTLATILDQRRSPELGEFAFELAARQGTIMPDFDELYRRKAELDQRAANTPLPNDSRE